MAQKDAWAKLCLRDCAPIKSWPDFYPGPFSGVTDGSVGCRRQGLLCRMQKTRFKRTLIVSTHIRSPKNSLMSSSNYIFPGFIHFVSYFNDYEIGFILDSMCAFYVLVVCLFCPYKSLYLNHRQIFQSKCLRRQCETQVYHW